MVTAVVAAGAAVVCARARERRGHRGTGTCPDPDPYLTPLTLWALAPSLITLVTVQWLHLFLDRYLLFTVPAWILLAAIGIEWLTTRLAPRPAVARGVALTLIAVLCASVPSGRSDIARNTPREPDYHAVATAVLADQRPGGGIAYTHRRKARRALDHELREGPRPRDVFLHETPQRRGDYEAGECPDPGRCAVGHQRI
ncbi:hypothetical protein [Streptomyces sp. NPDC057363]|uniref:hypothetical protein n=1 Tax=Streptomyces sp. NPDC057363 TaxID=3346107 RepID=UPI003632D149